MHTNSFSSPGSLEAQLVEYHKELKIYRRLLIDTPMRDFHKIMDLNRKIRVTEDIIHRIEDILLETAL